MLVVDGLDKIRPKELDSHGHTNHESLFIEHAHNFTDINCSMLLTIPVDLAYSVAAGRLPSLYGARAHTVSVVPVRDRNDQPFEQGEQALVDILGCRAREASGSVGAEAKDCAAAIFEDQALLQTFVRLSGGHVRGLLRALTELLDYADTLPIKAATFARYESQARAALVRGLTGEHRAILGQVSQQKLKIDDPRFFDLLRNEHVFAYESAHELDWYDVNPLLRGIA